jgi:hypothetical protein
MKGNTAQSWAGVAGLCLLGAFAGLVVATSPSLGMAIALLAMTACVMFLALAQRDTGDIGIGAQRAFVWALLGISVFWPTYVALQVEGAPRLDPRRLFGLYSFGMLLYLYVGRASIRQRVAHLSLAGKVALCVLGAMVLVRAYSAAMSPTPGLSVTAFFWELAGYFAPFVLGMLVLSSPDIRSTLVRNTLGIAMVCALIALLEFASHRNLVADLLLRFSNDPELQIAMTISRVRDGLLRAQGPFEHPLLLAEFGSIAFCFSAANILWPGPAGKGRGVAWVGLLAAFVCMVLSFSRSSLACAGVGALWLALLWLAGARPGVRVKRPALRLILMVVFVTTCVAVAAVAGRTVLAGKTQAEAESSAARAHMLDRGLYALEVHPLAGYGIGTAGDLAGVKGRARLVTLDNYLLILALESGIPYMGMFLVLFLLAVLAASFRALTGEPGGAYLAGAAAALLALMTMRTVLGINYNLPIAYLVAGLCFPVIEQARLQHRSRS